MTKMPLREFHVSDVFLCVFGSSRWIVIVCMYDEVNIKI